MSQLTSHPSGHRSRRRHAFTLVELLVVIGIIALLISILMPALGRARAAAQQVACASNMRQIGQAMAMYANDYGGALLPAEPAFQPTGMPWTSPRWWGLLVLNGYLPGKTGEATQTNKGHILGDRAGVFQCPGDPTGPVADAANGEWAATQTGATNAELRSNGVAVRNNGVGCSYFANSRVMYRWSWPGSSDPSNNPKSDKYLPVQAWKVTKFRNVTERMVLTEKNADANLFQGGLTLDPTNSPTVPQWAVDRVRAHHGGGGTRGVCNILYLDWHVDALPYKQVIDAPTRNVNGAVKELENDNLWGLSSQGEAPAYP